MREVEHIHLGLRRGEPLGSDCPWDCFPHGCVSSEKVRAKAVRTLEVRKVATIGLDRDYMISTVFDPNVGMQVIPYSRTRG